MAGGRAIFSPADQMELAILFCQRSDRSDPGLGGLRQ